MYVLQLLESLYIIDTLFHRVLRVLSGEIGLGGGGGGWEGCTRTNIQATPTFIKSMSSTNA